MDQNQAMVPHRQSRAIIPQSMAEVMDLADLLAKSSFIPTAFRGKPGDVVAAILYGAEIGMNPMQSLTNVAVINGKPSIYGDAALAVIRSSGLLTSIKEECDGTIAVCRVMRRGEANIVERTFSMEQAKRAGLLGKSGPWALYPERMLQMRARGFALRDAFPDVLAGLITAEEAEDYETVEAGPAPHPQIAAAPEAVQLTAEEESEREFLVTAIDKLGLEEYGDKWIAVRQKALGNRHVEYLGQLGLDALRTIHDQMVEAAGEKVAPQIAAPAPVDPITGEEVEAIIVEIEKAGQRLHGFKWGVERQRLFAAEMAADSWEQFDAVRLTEIRADLVAQVEAKEGVAA